MSITPNKSLKITQCSDGMMWYADKIGQVFPYLGEWPGDGYVSREPAGFINVVKFGDAEVIDVPFQEGADQ